MKIKSLSRVLILITSICVLTNCHQTLSDDSPIVKYDLSSKASSSVEDVISSIRIVPLETTKESMFGGMSSLLIAGNDYIIVDKVTTGKLYRFDTDGHFLNTIGNMGRGSDEYASINSVQLFENDIYIYSYVNEKIFVYSLSGELKRKIDVGIRAEQIFVVNGGYYAYLGFANGKMPERLCKLTDGKVVKKMLPSDAKVIPIQDFSPAMKYCNGNITLREPMTNIVYTIDNQDNITQLYRFDLGKYNIPANYYEMDNANESCDMLLSSDFGSCANYIAGNTHAVAQVNFQMGKSGTPGNCAIGFFDGSRWQWVPNSEDKADSSILCHTVQCLTSSDELVLLVSNNNITSFAKSNNSIFSNSNILSTLSEDNNQSILICSLK